MALSDYFLHHRDVISASPSGRRDKVQILVQRLGHECRVEASSPNPGKPRLRWKLEFWRRPASWPAGPAGTGDRM